MSIKIPNISPERQRSSDDFVITMIRDWRIARATQQIEWAQNQHADGFGTRESTDRKSLTFEGLTKMHEMESHLANWVPASVMAAREMLRVAIEIMAWAHVDPEATLAGGPVLDIVHNVTEALDNLHGDQCLGRPGRRRRSARRPPVGMSLKLVKTDDGPTTG
jgi:hypothetical protein